MSQVSHASPMRIQVLHALKAAGKKFSMVTAYDATFAYWASTSGIEVLLVGDTLGMVLQGRESTVPVTIEQMVYHTRSVVQGNQGSFVIADMPFMAASTSDEALANAMLLMQAGAHMIKIEGSGWLAETVSLLNERGIPVCVHLGLTPQSVHKLSGFKIQGRRDLEAEALIQSAKNLAIAGADLLLLECVPALLAKQITQSVEVPVVGIGAGKDTDAQVLVMQDLLGLTLGRVPKFCKNFLTEGRSIPEALRRYAQEVRDGVFPCEKYSYD